MNATKSLDAHTSRNMPRSFTPDTARTSLSDRRTSNRGPVQTKARLTLVDPLGDGPCHDIMTRDSSISETTFLLRESLSVGQMCRVELESNGHASRKYLAEVVRSRPITGGRYEMAIQFRKPL